MRIAKSNEKRITTEAETDLERVPSQEVIKPEPKHEGEMANLLGGDTMY
jgi:hypothetical protein